MSRRRSGGLLKAASDGSNRMLQGSAGDVVTDKRGGLFQSISDAWTTHVSIHTGSCRREQSVQVVYGIVRR